MGGSENVRSMQSEIEQLLDKLKTDPPNHGVPETAPQTLSPRDVMPRALPEVTPRGTPGVEFVPLTTADPSSESGWTLWSLAGTTHLRKQTFWSFAEAHAAFQGSGTIPRVLRGPGGEKLAQHNWSIQPMRDCSPTSTPREEMSVQVPVYPGLFVTPSWCGSGGLPDPLYGAATPGRPLSPAPPLAARMSTPREVLSVPAPFCQSPLISPGWCGRNLANEDFRQAEWSTTPQRRCHP